MCCFCTCIIAPIVIGALCCGDSMAVIGALCCGDSIAVIGALCCGDSIAFIGALCCGDSIAVIGALCCGDSIPIVIGALCCGDSMAVIGALCCGDSIAFLHISASLRQCCPGLPWQQECICTRCQVMHMYSCSASNHHIYPFSLLCRFLDMQATILTSTVVLI